MKLIVGLGNPGKEYKNTRHNIGFLIVDALATHCGALWKTAKKNHGEIAECTMEGEKCILFKPDTFMNNSGLAVSSALSWYKLTPEHLMVVHDDADIQFGERKLQRNRGAAGHNGVQSIIDALKTNDFTRLRVGIQPQQMQKIPAETLVLSPWSSDEKNALKKIIPSIIETVLNLL